MCSVLTGSPSATARFSSAWTIFSSEGLVIRRARLLARGAVECLFKPFSEPDLLGALNTALRVG